MWRAEGLTLMATVVALGMGGSQASAHNISVFAHVHGTEIHGEVMGEGEVPVAGARITAYSPAGAKLVETVSDAQGRFRLTVTQRCDWRIVAVSSGHRAVYTVAQSELPSELPHDAEDGGAQHDHEHASYGTRPGGDNEDDARASGSDRATEDSGAEAGPAGGPDSALYRQIVALRRDVDHLRQDLRRKDVVGGVGYILGLIGIAAYFLGARRRERSSR